MTAVKLICSRSSEENIVPPDVLRFSRPSDVHVDVVVVAITTTDEVFPILVPIRFGIRGVLVVAFVQGSIAEERSTALSFEFFSIQDRRPLSVLVLLKADFLAVFQVLVHVVAVRNEKEANLTLVNTFERELVSHAILDVGPNDLSVYWSSICVLLVITIGIVVSSRRFSNVFNGHGGNFGFHSISDQHVVAGTTHEDIVALTTVKFVVSRTAL